MRIFDNTSESFQSQIALRWKFDPINKNVVVVEKGDAARHMYYVREGELMWTDDDRCGLITMGVD